MCLTIQSTDPSSLKFVNGRITCYKVLCRHNGCLFSIIQDYNYNPGFNVAIGQLHTKEVVRGGAIHVCTTKNRAKTWCSFGSDVIVPVTCYKKDFIAKGRDGEACFKRVFISKENYNKALKSKSKYALINKRK